MFGFVVADAGALSEEEKERYRAVYCGLCLALRDRYGQLSRACLTYDLTFFVLLCNSLHEPAETQGTSHCVMHPAPAAPRAWARSAWTDYAADLSVALAYHKVLDDVADELSDPRFLRCHRSFIVNMDFIVDVRDDFILRDGTCVPVRVKERRKMHEAYYRYFTDALCAG